MLLIKNLQNTFPHAGTVTAVSVRPGRQLPVKVLDQVIAITEVGLTGDRHKTKNGKRQVTLIQHEHLDAVSSILQRPVLPEQVRRNIVVRGVNLLSIKGHRFKIGEAIFEFTGECHPCSRMEEALGQGGYNAMRGHGGITARIISGGVIRVGDLVEVIVESEFGNSPPL